MSQFQAVVNVLAILSMFVNAYLFYRICRLEAAADTPSASHNRPSSPFVNGPHWPDRRATPVEMPVLKNFIIG